MPEFRANVTISRSWQCFAAAGGRWRRFLVRRFGDGGAGPIGGGLWKRSDHAGFGQLLRPLARVAARLYPEIRADEADYRAEEAAQERYHLRRVREHPADDKGEGDQEPDERGQDSEGYDEEVPKVEGTSFLVRRDQDPPPS